MNATHLSRWLLAAALLLVGGAERALAAQPHSVTKRPKTSVAQKPKSVPRPVADPNYERIPRGRVVDDTSHDDRGALEEPYGDWLDEPTYDDSTECCDDQGSDCCSHGRCGGRGVFYGGAEYLLVKPRFSEAVAEVRRTIVLDETATPETSTQTDQSVEYPYDYQSSFRTFVGYRLCDCGGEIQFTYWRLQGDAEIADGPAQVESGNLIIFGQLGNNPCEGEFFRARSSVDANLYDLDFSRCIPVGGSSCCDPCGCPRWDLRWMAGFRIADINRHDQNLVTGTTSEDCLGVGNINADFTGAGPRVGMQGRRYFGCTGRLSAYAKSNGALLLGGYDVRRVLRNQTVETESIVTTVQEENLTRLIPNAEIELGTSWQLGPHAYFSAGWFFQAWFDLGSSQEIVGSTFGALDDANILAFDGLFARMEMMF